MHYALGFFLGVLTRYCSRRINLFILTPINSTILLFALIHTKQRELVQNRRIMKHISIILAVIILLAALSAKDVNASAKIAGNSALFAAQSIMAEDARVTKLRAYLETYDSPLTDSAETFVREADKHNLDWKFVAAIAGVESWYGHRIPYNSNNAWGYGVYGGNVRRFASWDEAIITISEDIRVKYMNTWGAKDIYDIGRIYAADPKWASKVMFFMKQIDAFEPIAQTLPISI